MWKMWLIKNIWLVNLIAAMIFMIILIMLVM